MNLGPLEDAIYTRLSGDTGSGGLLETGSTLVDEISNGFREPVKGIAKPIVVFVVDSASQEDGADIEIVSVQIMVHTLVDRESGPTSARAAVDRIFGDAAAQGGAPTFGLHRWKPGALSAGNSTIMRRISHSTNHDQDFYEYIDVFAIEQTLDFS